MADDCLQLPPLIDGNKIAEGKAFNKKDASQIAAQMAVDNVGDHELSKLNVAENDDQENQPVISLFYFLHNSINTPFVVLDEENKQFIVCSFFGFFV